MIKLWHIKGVSQSKCEELTFKAVELTNEKYRRQWRPLVETYAIPVLGNLPVRDVSVHDLATLLRPIWTSKPESARKLAHNLGGHGHGVHGFIGPSFSHIPTEATRGHGPHRGWS